MSSTLDSESEGDYFSFAGKTQNRAFGGFCQGFQMSFSVCPVLDALFCLSCSGCPICLSCSGCPVLAVLFWMSCSGCPVRAVLFWMSCSGCPVLAVLSLPYIYISTCARKETGSA
jgi:hypothetical protein